MPLYVFYCEKCDHSFEVLCRYEEAHGVLCEKCSQPSERQLTASNVIFAKPQETSKWDNFEYRAGFNLEKAKAERRNAEEKSHMGQNPYTQIDDISCGEGIRDSK